MKRCMLIAVALVNAACHKQEAEPEVKPVVSVKVAPVTTADLTQSVQAPATLFPRAQANIAARLTAPIRELRAKKGDRVGVNQILALLDNRDLVAQRQEVQGAVTDAQQTLQKTATGTIPSDIERAKGQVDVAKATLDQAQKTFERRQELLKQGAIPSRDLLVTQTELATAQSTYNVAVQSLQLLQNQGRTGDLAIGQSRVEQAQGRLAQVNAQIQFTEIRSPFAGIITEQFQYPGDMAKPDVPMFTIVDLSTAVARAQVPEGEVVNIQRGQTCQFTSPDTGEMQAQGRVSVVNQAVDPQRRTVEVWCEIAKPDAALRAGLFGQVRIFTGAQKSALVVPVSAVQFAEGTRNGTVLVVDSKRVAHTREVECGEPANGRVPVLKGLKAGEMVVTEGGYGTPDGATVKLPGDKEDEKDKKE